MLDDGSDAVGNILIIDYQMRGRVALVGPKGCAEFCTAHGLTSRDSAGRGSPSGAPAVGNLPTDGPRGPAQEGVGWVARCSISPERAGEITQRGGPIVWTFVGWGAR